MVANLRTTWYLRINDSDRIDCMDSVTSKFGNYMLPYISQDKNQKY